MELTVPVHAAAAAAAATSADMGAQSTVSTDDATFEKLAQKVEQGCDDEIKQTKAAEETAAPKKQKKKKRKKKKSAKSGARLKKAVEAVMALEKERKASAAREQAARRVSEMKAATMAAAAAKESTPVVVCSPASLLPALRRRNTQTALIATTTTVPARTALPLAPNASTSSTTSVHRSRSIVSLSTVSGSSRRSASLSSSLSRPKQVPATQRRRRICTQFGAYHSGCMKDFVLYKDNRWDHVAAPAIKDEKVYCPLDRPPLDILWWKYECIGTMPSVPIMTVSSQRSFDALFAALTAEQVEGANVEWVYHAVPSKCQAGVPPLALESLKTNLTPRWDTIHSGHASQQPEWLRYVHLAPPMVYPPNMCFVGCFKSAAALWKKHSLYHVMKLWCDADAERRGSVRERLPHTVTVNVHDAGCFEVAREQLNYLRLEHNVGAFIAKHSTGANGRSILVTRSVSEAVEHMRTSEKKNADETSEKGEWWVVQEFIRASPLVFDGRRFHLRMHALVIAAPHCRFEIFAFHKNRVQVCNETFEWDTMELTPDAAVSNWARQRRNSRFDTKTFYHYIEDMIVEYPLLAGVVPRAQRIIGDAVAAALEFGGRDFRTQMGCFEVFGFDFLVEEVEVGRSTKWVPLLLEGNHRPGFAANRKFVEEMFCSALSLVVFPSALRLSGDTSESVCESWIPVRTIVVKTTSREPEAGEQQSNDHDDAEAENEGKAS
eukprot:PhM_4_TR17515/c0_g1_i1/m.51094